MKPNIIVLSTPLLHSLMEDFFKTLLPEGGYRVVDYTDLKNIASVYASLENEADGFILAGGRVARVAIQKALKTTRKPIASFMLNSTSFYRLLLNLLLNDRALDFHRVMLDVFIPLHKYSSIADISDDKKAVILEAEYLDWSRSLPLDDIYFLEERAARKITALWKAKKIDLVICTYSGIMQRLQEKSVPCVFAYPDVETVRVALNGLLSDIQIAAMRDNLPVVISISLKNEAPPGESESNAISLHKSLLDFNREHASDLLVQKTYDGFEIFTSLRVANNLTDNFQTCKLSSFLSDRLNFKVNIGYGIGRDIAQARTNAANAKKETAVSGGVYMIGEKNNLIGPLDSERYLAITAEITPEIYRIAEKAKLSTLTIQKIDSVMKLLGTNLITTQELAVKLGVSIRNAQRILSALEKNGFAVVQNHKSTTTKGRPVKVYKITFVTVISISQESINPALRQ